MADEMGADGGIAPESSSDGAAETSRPAPENPSSPLLSNADIDKLLASLGAEEEPASSPPEPGEEPGVKLLSNDDLEELLAAMEVVSADPAPTAEVSEAPAENAPAPEPTSSLLSNADIDKLISSMTENGAASPTASEDAGLESTPSEPEPPAGVQSSEILNGDELEKLAASILEQSKLPPVKRSEPAFTSDMPEEPSVLPEEPAPPTGKQTHELLTSADLEKLLESMKSGPPPKPSESVEAQGKQTSELLSNDDIETLLASMNAAPEPDAEDAPAAKTPSADRGSTELLSNADIESLLLSDEPLPQDAADDSAESGAPAAEQSGGTTDPLSNDDIDALLARLNASAEPDAEDAAPTEAAEDPAAKSERAAEVLNNSDMESLLDTLGGGAVGGEAAPESQVEPERTVESTVVATAAVKEEPEAQGEILSQDLIESLVRGARHRQSEPDVAPPAEPPPPPPEVKEVAVAEEPLPERPIEAAPRKPGWLTTRLAASLALGFFSGACVYLYLASHPYRAFNADAMDELRMSYPGQALGVARGLAQGDRFSEARSELKSVLSNLPPGEARTNAEFVDLEAAYRLLPDNAKVPVLKDMIRTIDRLLGEAPDHPKAREAWLWKADLLQRAEMPEAAYEVYSQVLAQPDNPQGFDKGLLGAAKVALDIERPNDAINHLRRLLQAFPSSPLRADAEYLLGNAYLAAGDMEAGRMTLMSVAKANPDSELGADAYARLGGLSYDAGDYDEAIRLFESRLQTATKVAGNDKIYLLLARAHRMKGDLPQAERVLKELIDFFPESTQIPAALVELSQVLEGLGRRDEAVKIAKQAAEQYGKDPAVLENAGHFLVDTGEAAAGADTLVAAEHAGAENPGVLLEAARQYRAAKELDKAGEVYQRLLDDYSNTTEAFQAGIELARVDFEKGRVRDALARMEQNATDAKGRPAYPEALDALASLYEEVGLRNRATETFRQMAGETSDPIMLARAALTLFDAGQPEDALTLTGRIDKGALPEPLAYGLLMRQGRALAATNPEQALALMEQAYMGYPDDRRPEDVQRLLESYLALDRTAAARALVVDAETRAKGNPSEIPTLEAAAARWGDHLFQRGDYTAAEEAYALASNAAGGDAKASRSETSVWSRYQQANCLFRQEDLVGCLPLFEEVAGGTSPWSDLARAKADYVGLEMRRRGIVPPAPVPAATEPPGAAEPPQQTPVAPPPPEPAQPAAAEITPPASEG